MEKHQTRIVSPSLAPPSCSDLSVISAPGSPCFPIRGEKGPPTLPKCCAEFPRTRSLGDWRPNLSSVLKFLCPWGFSRQEYWSRLPCPPPGDLPKPGIEPRSLALQADSLLTEPHGKPKNSRVGRLSLLQGIFLTQELNRGLLHCRWILYQLSYQGSPCMTFIPQFKLYGEAFRLHVGHDGEPQGTFRKEMPLSCCTHEDRSRMRHIYKKTHQ